MFAASLDSTSEDLAFEFKALELALEIACMSLDAQVTELEIEVYPVLDELASSISTLNLERVRRQKSHLLALTHRVQKVRDDIEQLMDDDGDMAEMYLTYKKERMESCASTDQYFLGCNTVGLVLSRSAPVSPVSSMNGYHKLGKTTSSVISSSKHGSLSSVHGCIEELEMLLEAYFVVIDNTLSKLLSVSAMQFHALRIHADYYADYIPSDVSTGEDVKLKEYIDDTEDFINIKLDNVRNQLIQFELLLTAATFVAAIFAVVTGVFGMNFTPPFFSYPGNFNLVLIVTSIACTIIYSAFILHEAMALPTPWLLTTDIGIIPVVLRSSKTGSQVRCLHRLKL
ncbi:hypothetical protein ACLOJK_002482 [Asimina triloba]